MTFYVCKVELVKPVPCVFACIVDYTNGRHRLRPDPRNADEIIKSAQDKGFANARGAEVEELIFEMF